MTTQIKAILIASIAFIICFSGMSQQVAKSIPNSTSPDGRIGFYEFRPPDYGTQRHPLIIFLHGAGEVGNGSSQLYLVATNALPNTLAQGGASMRFSYNGQASSFVVLSPQLSAAYGNWRSFYITEMINYAKANLSIDPNRIYITGLSLGGGGILRLMTDAYTVDPSFDSNIAAVAPICSSGEQSDVDYCRTVGANHLPIWAFHCMDDTRISVSVTQHIEQLSRNCGVTPASKFTYYATGNHSGAWILAYDFGHITRQLADGTNYTFTQNLYEWFLSNSRSNVTPPPGNTPPTVSAGVAQTITLPTNAVNLTGSGAGTNGATIASFTWTQTGGPSTATILAPGSTSTTVTGLVQGTYVFTFTVKDNNGLSSNATVTVTVNPPVANTPPAVTVGGAQTITLPANAVTLTGTGTGTNGATINTYTWTQSSGPSTAVIVAAGSTSTQVTGLVQGTYVFTFTVKDNNGLSTSKTVTVTVNPAAGFTPPDITIGGPQTITLPNNAVTLTGTGAGTNGSTITGYTWVQTSGPATAVIVAPASTNTQVTGLVQGNYIFTFTVIDNHSLTTSGTVSVTVNPATGVNQPPISNAGSAITVTTSTFTLDGTASTDADGRIVEYYWMRVSGPNIPAIANNFGGTTAVTGLINGVYTFLLQVKDNNGALAYSTKIVTVALGTPPPPPPPPPPTGNQPPISNAGSAQTITLPISSVTLNGTASTDPDGTIIQYYWTQVSGPSSSVIANNFGGTITASGLVRGVYTFQLQVKDNEGIPAWSTTTVTVNAAAGARIAATDAALTGNDAGLKFLGGATTSLSTGKSLGMYPNPGITTSTIELNSADTDVKKIALYNASGVLVASYRWPTVPGRNIYVLKNIAGLAKGLYIIHITDSKGTSTGTLKFVKG